LKHLSARNIYPQGIGNVTFENVGVGLGEIECRERIGGILKHYARAA
jgi:hypothetical protein